MVTCLPKKERKKSSDEVQEWLCVCVCVCMLSGFSHVPLFATLWTVALQAPLSMGFSRQEYWSELPCPSPGDLPHPGIKPVSPSLAGGFFTAEPPGEPGTESLVRPRLERNSLFVHCLFFPAQFRSESALTGWTGQTGGNGMMDVEDKCWFTTWMFYSW